MSEEADDRLSVLDRSSTRPWPADRPAAGCWARSSTPSRALAQPDLAALAGDLFAVVDALEAIPALRRALTDPSTPEDGRRQLAHGAARRPRSASWRSDIVAEAAAMRWAGGRTLAAALERQAVRAELLRADEAGRAGRDRGRVVPVRADGGIASRAAQRAGRPSVDRAGRQELVAELLAGRATRLHGATGPASRGGARADLRPHHRGLRHPGGRPAEPRRGHRPGGQAVDSGAAERLRAALSRQIGRDVAIQEIVDEPVIGGVRVELGDEVIEGTVAGRLEDADGCSPDHRTQVQAPAARTTRARTHDGGTDDSTRRDPGSPGQVRRELHSPTPRPARRSARWSPPATVSPGSRVCRRRWPTSCWSSRTAPWASP